MKIALVAKFCIGTLGKVSHQSSIYCIIRRMVESVSTEADRHLEMWIIAIDVLSIQLQLEMKIAPFLY